MADKDWSDTRSVNRLRPVATEASFTVNSSVLRYDTMTLTKPDAEQWIDRHGTSTPFAETEGAKPTAYIDGTFYDPSADTMIARQVDGSDGEGEGDYAIVTEVYRRGADWYTLTYPVHGYNHLDTAPYMTFSLFGVLLYLLLTMSFIASPLALPFYPSIGVIVFLTGLSATLTFAPKAVYWAIGQDPTAPDPSIEPVSRAEALENLNRQPTVAMLNELGTCRATNEAGMIYELNSGFYYVGPKGDGTVYDNKQAMQRELQGPEKGRLVRRAFEAGS